jgi:uncharacterized protein YciI
LSHFVYVVRPTRLGMLDEPTAEEQAIVREHFQYLQGLLAAGRLLLAGPAPDRADTFGIVIFTADDLQRASATMNADPAVVNGVMTATVHPFRVAVSSLPPSESS